MDNNISIKDYYELRRGNDNGGCKSILIWSVVVVLIISLCVILSSCYTQKKAVSQFDKALNKFPDTTTALFRSKYPCITTASDTVFKAVLIPGRIDSLYKTDTLNIACPDSAGVKIIRTVQYKYLTTSKTDTVKITNTITNTVKDSSYQERIDTVTKDRDKWKAKAESKQKWIWWLIVICLLLLVGNIIQYKFKK
jgi:hypothetical protein